MIATVTARQLHRAVEAVSWAAKAKCPKLAPAETGSLAICCNARGVDLLVSVPGAVARSNISTTESGCTVERPGAAMTNAANLTAFWLCDPVPRPDSGIRISCDPPAPRIVPGRRRHSMDLTMTLSKPFVRATFVAEPVDGSWAAGLAWDAPNLLFEAAVGDVLDALVPVMPLSRTGVVTVAPMKEGAQLTVESNGRVGSARIACTRQPSSPIHLAARTLAGLLAACDRSETLRISSWPSGRDLLLSVGERAARVPRSYPTQPAAWKDVDPAEPCVLNRNDLLACLKAMSRHGSKLVTVGMDGDGALLVQAAQAGECASSFCDWVDVLSGRLDSVRDAPVGALVATLGGLRSRNVAIGFDAGGEYIVVAEHPDQGRRFLIPLGGRRRQPLHDEGVQGLPIIEIPRLGLISGL